MPSKLIRQRIEDNERLILAPQACFSAFSKGRAEAEKPCDLRTDFQRDRDRILHCKSFRRLKHKTQVFIAPDEDHLRTRLTHTLEVAQISRTVARALALNEDLTEAIALGHDLGHTPFGHAGEEALNQIYPGGFKHNEQSLRVVDYLEKLNLTWEVRDGILNHTGDELPATWEGQIVRICDRIAYLNHDIDDAGRAELLRDIPAELKAVLGATHRQRIDTLVKDLIFHSEQGILQGKIVKQAMEDLREFMFQEVYYSPYARQEANKAKQVVRGLYQSYQQELPESLKAWGQGISKERLICDYVAGMTDQFALREFKSRVNFST